jgi:hypothetical protein
MLNWNETLDDWVVSDDPGALREHELVKVRCRDVLEHIEPQDEDSFLRNIRRGMTTNGVMVVGMPSIESQVYASEASRVGHVNCKRSEDLRTQMLLHFSTVFSFAMNDEVIHTGFPRMANYIFAIGCGPKGN